MSYILEALKKAQAERELGRVPPLQGSASALNTGVAHATSSRAPRWVWPAALLVVVLAVTGAVAWWLGRQAAVPAAAQPQVAVAAPVAPPTPVPAAARVPQAVVQAPELPPVAPPVKPPPPAAATAAEDAVTALEALDPALRSRLPPLVSGGTIQSSERAQRMVVLDGQVLREGDSLTNDVSVMAIEPQGVVLRLGASYGNRRVRLKP